MTFLSYFFTTLSFFREVQSTFHHVFSSSHLFFRGVQFIHSQRILHLDLKPFNIMFANPDDDYNLRIIDFGLSETLENTEDGQVKMTMCGTLEYMSPEVMDCKFASPASDMW